MTEERREQIRSFLTGRRMETIRAEIRIKRRTTKPIGIFSPMGERLHLPRLYRLTSASMLAKVRQLAADRGEFVNVMYSRPALDLTIYPDGHIN